MVDYSERLKAAMDYAGVKIPALAAALGVSYQAIKKVLDGKSKSLDANNNAQAAKFLSVSHHWLATGEGDMLSNLEINQPLASESIAPGATNEVATIGQTVGRLNALLVGVDAGTRETIANLTQEAICKPDKAQANIAAIEALVRFATGKIETAALRSATHS